MKNFWAELNKASRGSVFFCLAPMYDVTDAAFRQMFVKYSKRDSGVTVRSRIWLREKRLLTVTPLVLFTEFVSADGLVSEAGKKKLWRELYFTEAERPIVAQIFGANPVTIETAVRLIKELGFDGVDINMGCPDRAVEKQGAGASLIKNPKLAKEIILAAKRGASDEMGKQIIPVSIKTRLGYNKIDDEWIKTILKARPDAVTFHLRTRKEMSEAPAHWEEMKKIMALARELADQSGGERTIIIGNGDVASVEQGRELAQKYGVDGVMIGRGAFGQPWLFNPLASLVRRTTSGALEVALLTIEARLQIMLEHSKIFAKLYLPGKTNDKLFNGHTKNFAVMRKHFKAYVAGFKGATALRAKLMSAENPTEVEKIINDFLSHLAF